MEKMILTWMEIATFLQKGELREQLELAKTSSDPLSYVAIEILQNELNKREGKRHISLEKAKQYYQIKSVFK